MTLNEYQQTALDILKTAPYPEEYRIIYPAIGISGEAGEVADKVKKVIRDNNNEFTEDKRKEIAREVSDVLWGCAIMANDLGYTFEEIGQMNKEKLESRKERGVLGGSGDNR